MKFRIVVIQLKNLRLVIFYILKMCEDVIKPKIASSIGLEEKQKEVGNRPKNTG